MNPFGSVRSRVIALVVGVTAIAIGLTAWLSTQSAEQAVRDSAEQSLERDAAIYQRLVEYGWQNDSWIDVETVLADLAATYDRRVALTDVRGRLLADSDRADGGSSRPLPSRPTAELDPANPTIAQFGGSFGGSFPSEVIGELGSGTMPSLIPDPGIIAAAEACLSSEGLDYVLVDTGGVLLPQPSGTLDPFQFDEFEACTEPVFATEIVVAAETASPPATAPAVLLYIGTKTSVSPFAGPSLWRTMSIAGAILALASLAAWLLGRRLTRPLAELTSAAGRLEAGDFTHRVPSDRTTEIGVLSTAFNSLATSLQRNEVVRRQMVSDIAHELRNPLVTINGTLEAIEDGVYEPTPAVMSSLTEEAAHLNRLVQDLQELATADAGGLRVVLAPGDLTEVATASVEAHQAVAARAGVVLRVEAAGPVSVMVDSARMRQVLGNLIGNAVRHTAAGGKITVAVQPDGFAVTDTGEGIASEDVPFVFDRFWRADPSRTRSTGGTGLGLAIAKEIVAAHGADLTVTSQLGVGSTFAVSGLSTL